MGSVNVIVVVVKIERREHELFGSARSKYQALARQEAWVARRVNVNGSGGDWWHTANPSVNNHELRYYSSSYGSSSSSR